MKTESSKRRLANLLVGAFVAAWVAAVSYLGCVRPPDTTGANQPARKLMPDEYRGPTAWELERAIDGPDVDSAIGYSDPE